MNKCFFCEVAKQPSKYEDVFYEDDNVFAMLDTDWAVKGHVLIVWKKHKLNMSDLTEVEFTHFSKVCRRIESRLLKYLNVDKSVVLKSGGLESHFHFHIYPIISDTPWKDIKAMFDKTIQYSYTDDEKNELLSSLRTL